MRNHSSRFHRKPKQDTRQQILAMGKSPSDSNKKLTTYKFDIEVERELFAQVIMKHDLLFLFAEYEYFRNWLSYLCLTYNFRIRTTLRTDCMKVFKLEKEKVYKML